MGPVFQMHGRPLRLSQCIRPARQRQVLDSCDAEAVLAVLVHKLVEAAAANGAAEGHALLHDWLSILTAQYNRCILGLSPQAPAHQVPPPLEPR